MEAEEVKKLTREDLENLDDTQLSWLPKIQLKRTNDNARARVEKALDGRVKEIAAAVTTAPCIYVSPDIKVISGCNVRFATLIRSQSLDIDQQVDKFVGRENPSNFRTADYMNQLFLAHALVKVNDQDFGGVVFDAHEYQDLRRADPARAQEILAQVRDKRLEALDTLSPHVFQRIVEHYHAFAVLVDSLTQGDDIGDVLGN